MDNAQGDKPYVEALSRIRSHLPSLADSEITVANWVLEQAEQVIDLSMAQVANACGVSDTTVLRFCRSCGFHGFMDLKLSIARDMASPSQLIHDAITETDDVATVTRKVFTANIQALHDTLAMIDMNAVTRAVDMLEKARRILIIGVGTSSPVVEHMYNELFRLGLNCRAQTDSYLQLMDAALIEPGDVVVGISQSGGSVDPVLTMERAKANGAGTICVTGNRQSPITQHADVILLSVSNETRAETIASRIAQITLIDALYVALSLRNMEKTVQNERRIWDAILAKTI